MNSSSPADSTPAEYTPADSTPAEYTPADLAALLGLDPPSAEQAAVIAAPLAPVGVVAGAGSGKTATMAARVVWLVANGHVRPEAVLGLTFTRKAAAELGSRVRRRLDALRALSVVAAPGPDGPAGESGGQDAAGWDGIPAVSTYHAYAGRLVAEHALREAREPNARLISPAVQRQLAARAVARYDGPMDAVDTGPAWVVDATLALAGELAEHLREPVELREELRRWQRRIDELPGRRPSGINTLSTTMAKALQLLPLVVEYQEAKESRGLLDYGDQVALAARIAAGHPEVGVRERARYRVVLLDEYQDTGHAQRTLLRALFGDGHPVTAVGDSCQSIYGWRGASAGGLRRFAGHFPAGGRPAPVRHLSRSFRNAGRILQVANALAEPLRAEDPDLPVLVAADPDPGCGRVECALLETAADEADWVAERIATVLGSTAAKEAAGDRGLSSAVRASGDREEQDPALGTDRTPGSGPGGARARGAAAAVGGSGVAADPDGNRAGSSAGPAGSEASAPVRAGEVAVLCRKRSQFPAVRRALEQRGIPVEVVGLGGLLTVPEVLDIVAVLNVLANADAGPHMVRLLTGARLRLGARDLVALGERARALAAGAAGGQTAARGAEPPSQADPLEEALRAAQDFLPGSLVEAVDDPGVESAYSAVGYFRIRALGAELRGLRSRLDQPLPDLVADVERTLGLSLEVASRPGAAGVSGRADLDAFADAAAEFAGEEEEPTLTAFLAFLVAAQEEEFGLDPGRVGTSESVKVMTIHAAKGLEWPVVAIPGLAAGSGSGVFPARNTASTKWTRNARLLPFPLRGDAADLPRLGELDAAGIQAFEQDCDRRDSREERRLAYVAVTRAGRALFCSGYWWGEGKKPLGPSSFLTEIRDVAAAQGYPPVLWCPEPGADARNPSSAVAESAVWPVPVQGSAHDALRAGAELVRAAVAARNVGPAGASGGRTPTPGQGADRSRSQEATLGAREGAESARSADEPVGAGEAAESARSAEEPLGPGEPAEPGRSADGTLGVDDAALVQSWRRDVDLLLAERAAAAAAPQAGADVVLPSQLSVTTLVEIAADPGAVAHRLRRPLPVPPAPRRHLGRAFHDWVEMSFGSLPVLDLEDFAFPGEADLPDGEAELAALQAAFRASEWWHRKPVALEVPFETPVGGVLLRGRMDAVFRDDDGGFTVVDWKTGRAPEPDAEAARAVQLAVYRLAWAALRGVPLRQVRAAFHYVGQGQTVRPVDLLDAAGLRALIDRLPAGRFAAGHPGGEEAG